VTVSPCRAAINGSLPPFSGYWFRDRRSEAGLPHCSAYGLRKASLRETAQASCSEDIHRLDQRPQ
jgi:hypothetical protein